MSFQRLGLLILFLGVQCLASAESSYISIQSKNGRFLFHSTKYGDFFSVGSNSFMESAANIKMKAAFKMKPFKKIYREQLQTYLSFGFNSLGGWSNNEYLFGKLPYSVMLFDDDLFPHEYPFKDCTGHPLPSGDADPLPNPLNDPFDARYRNKLKKYLHQMVAPNTKDPALLLYWIGHEFGVGGSDYINLSAFTYSPGIQKEFAIWLKQKYKTITALNEGWGLQEKSFESITRTCPHSSSRENSDRKSFITFVLKTWFELVTKEIRKIDPNHLISSPKFSVWDHQPQLELAEADGHFDSMKGLFDLISVDWYTPNPQFSEKALSQVLNISNKLNLPILVAEFGTRQKIEGWTNTPGAKTLLSSQIERGERYKSQLMQLFDEKRFVGAHWFRWQDHITDTQQMNKGMVQTDGAEIQPYYELQKAMSEVHQEINKKLKAQ